MPATAPLAIELITDNEFGGFTARLPDIPAYGEGMTEQEAIADLRKALIGYLETFGADERRAGGVSPLMPSTFENLGR